MAGIFKIRVNNTNVGNFGKKIECTDDCNDGFAKFKFKHTSYIFYDQQEL